MGKEFKKKKEKINTFKKKKGILQSLKLRQLVITGVQITTSTLQRA